MRQNTTTGKQIIFPLYDELKEFIESEMSYIEDINDGERIFEEFNSEIIHKRFQRLKASLKITEKNIYTLKTFRKTFASYLAAKGMDKTKIADLLGHENPKTTMKYYAAISASSLRNELNNIFGVRNDVKSADKSADTSKK